MSKKVLYVIVEGPSDETALGLAFSQWFSQDNVYVKVNHCDITSKRGVNSTNIISKITELVKKTMKDEHFEKSDFKEIVHIVDTDGTYVPEDRIVLNPVLEKTQYSQNKITTNNVEAIKDRNAQKSSILNRLCCTPTIWKIPYKIYYMSSNLDHVLHNKMNSSDDEKEDDAYEFAERYRGKANDFVDFISNSDFSNSEDYKESWEYIKEDLHSLERQTNLGLCFKEE